MKFPFGLVASACVLLAAPVLALAQGRAAAATVAGDPVVELEKFVVTDSRELPQPESWRYGNIAGFEILSNASNQATQRLLRDFDEFRQALGYAWPIPQDTAQTTSLIISGRGGKFDAFKPTGRVGADVATATRFLKQGNRTAIVVDLQATTLDVLDVSGTNSTETGTDASLVSVQHDKALYREYVRFLLSRSEPRLPAWFEEGLSQIVMKMNISSRRWIEFAKLEDPNAVSASAALTAQLNAQAVADDPDSPLLAGAPAEDRDFTAALNRRGLVRLDRFFAVTHDSPEANNVLGNNIWAKQAYAFVHLGLYGHKGKYQKAFQTFLVRAAREPVTEAMFKECFGLTYKEMLVVLRGYIDSPYYDSRQFRSKKDGPDLIVKPSPVVLREATQSEIGRIKGEAMILAGRRGEARTELIAPYLRGERDPNLLAVLGLYENESGSGERARGFLEAAYAAKTTRADALLELARLRYADATAKPDGPGQGLSEQQVRAVAEPLLIARRQPAATYAIYDLLADTWARSAVKITPEDARPVIEGAMLYPSRLKLVYQCIFFAAETGDLRSAHALADHGIKYSPEGPGKQRFVEAKAGLPPFSGPTSPVK